MDKMGWFWWFFKGGIIMYPIALCSIVAAAIWFDRLAVLRQARVDTKSFMERIRETVGRGGIKEALGLCELTPGPIATIFKAGLVKSDRPRQEIKEAIEAAGGREIRLLEKRFDWLMTIASIAPLLGFLGTVTGMVRTFQVVQLLGGYVDAAALAGGIWEALLTTVFGLGVAIPVILVHNYLVNRVESLVWEMEESSEELIDLLTARSGK